MKVWFYNTNECLSLAFASHSQIGLWGRVHICVIQDKIYTAQMPVAMGLPFLQLCFLLETFRSITV